MKQKFDISNIAINEIKLSWISPVIDQFSAIVMTQSQLDWLCFHTDEKAWRFIRGIPIEIKQ